MMSQDPTTNMIGNRYTYISLSHGILKTRPGL